MWTQRRGVPSEMQRTSGPAARPAVQKASVSITAILSASLKTVCGSVTNQNTQPLPDIGGGEQAELLHCTDELCKTVMTEQQLEKGLSSKVTNMPRTLKLARTRYSRMVASCALQLPDKTAKPANSVILDSLQVVVHSLAGVHNDWLRVKPAGMSNCCNLQLKTCHNSYLS